MTKNTSIKNTNFAVVDIETTGLSPNHGHGICEIAVMRVKGGKEKESFCSLINPGIHISRGASYVNGITDDMVEDSPEFGDIVYEVLKLFDDAVIVCHNAPFDLKFIFAQMRKLRINPPDNPVIDTLLIARRYYNFPSNSLGYIARELCIPVDDEHRAMGDVLTTKRVLDCFLEDFNRDRKIKKLVDLLKM